MSPEYEVIHKEIAEEWPEWKRKIYNEEYALSKHAKKIKGVNNVEVRYSNEGYESSPMATSEEISRHSFLPYCHSLFKGLRLIFSEWDFSKSKLKILTNEKEKIYEQGYKDGLNKAYDIINYEIGQAQRGVLPDKDGE